MKSTIVISAVVLMHAAVFSLIGCNSQSGFEDIGASTNRDRAKGTTASDTPSEVTRTTAPAPTAQPVNNGFADTQPIVEPRHDPAPDPAEQSAGSKTYIVKRGDSSSRIAKQEGVSRHALASANGLPDNAHLKEKQKLIIPPKGTGLKGGKSTTTTSNTTTTNNTPTTPNNVTADPAPIADGSRTHTVKSGEVLGGIARKYGTTVAKIKEVNGITDERKVRVGRKLTIPPATPKATSAPQPAESAPAPQPVVDPTHEPAPQLAQDPGTVTVTPLQPDPQPDETPSEAVRTTNPAPVGAGGF